MKSMTLLGSTFLSVVQTIPQVYLKGEFLGGSDILIEMYNSGSLKEKIEIELAS